MTLNLHFLILLSLQRLNCVFVTASSGDLLGNSCFCVFFLFASIRTMCEVLLCCLCHHGSFACVCMLVCIMTIPFFPLPHQWLTCVLITNVSCADVNLSFRGSEAFWTYTRHKITANTQTQSPTDLYNSKWPLQHSCPPTQERRRVVKDVEGREWEIKASAAAAVCVCGRGRGNNSVSR